MNNQQLTPGIAYLHDRIRNADQMIAILLEQLDAAQKKIAELEQIHEKDG